MMLVTNAKKTLCCAIGQSSKMDVQNVHIKPFISANEDHTCNVHQSYSHQSERRFYFLLLVFFRLAFYFILNENILF